MRTKGISRSLVVSGLLATVALACAQGVVQGVEVETTKTGVDVIIRGTNLPQPSSVRTSKGMLSVWSFKSTLQVAAGVFNVPGSGVSSVSWAKFGRTGSLSRVTLRLKPTQKPVLSKQEYGWKITVANPIALPVVTEVLPEPPKDSDMMGNPILPGITDSRSTVEVMGEKSEPENGLNGIIGKNPPKETIVASETAVRPANPFLESVLPTQAKKGNIQLVFDDADLTQVLKALAIQAGVNIITAPDVKGNLTISMKNVTLEEALDLITATNGLRYEVVGSTIVVATPDKLVGILRSVQGKQPVSMGTSETRIIPIFSRQGRQIKGLVYRSMSPVDKTGRYEILLPSEEGLMAIPSTPGPVEAADAGKTTADGKPMAPAPAPTSSPDSKGDEYIIVLGSAARLDAIEARVRNFDQQICAALGMEVEDSPNLVTQTYATRGALADSLLLALGAKEGKVGEVKVTATPKDSNSRQTVVMTGRQGEVNRLMRTLSDLDGTFSADETFEVYEIAYSDPRSLRDELVVQVPGVRASIAPSSVGNPRTYSNRGNSMIVSQTTTTEAAKQATTNDPNQGTSKASVGLGDGLEQPFTAVEPIALPMRLILRGTKEQMSRAKDVLAAMDVPPRQAALEVRVMEISKDEAVNIGIDWNIFTGGAVKFIRLNNTFDNPSNTAGVGIRDKNFTGDVIGQLDKLSTKNNLIARPNLIAPDGRESEIFVGDVIRYVESVISSQNGPTVQIGTVRVGVNLAFLPRISSSGTMNLEVRPKVSFLRRFDKFSISGFTAELPQTSERLGNQNFTLSSGETIAIGGLIQSQDVSDMKGVPILMDLPILGQFFRRTTTTTVRRELVIFVTANAIMGPLNSQTDSLPFAEDVKKKGKGGKN